MKPINITEFIPSIMASVEESLANIKACDTKVNISWDISSLFKSTVKDLLKTHIDIEILPWTKMVTLIDAVSTELAWHCIVDRIDRDHFIIRDVMMYPQEVTGTAVDSNDAKYPDWLNAIDDETFARIRGQGHSHVHMGSTPSGADTAFYQRMLTSVTDYYIFFIMNKKGDLWVNLYDVQHNLIYEQEDIVVSLVDNDGNDIDLWASEQLKFIEKKVVPVVEKKEPLFPTNPYPTNPYPAAPLTERAKRTLDEAEAYYDRLLRGDYAYGRT
jgi:hypothetical protein